jgi:hypothetical protein
MGIGAYSITIAADWCARPDRVAGDSWCQCPAPQRLARAILITKSHTFSGRESAVMALPSSTSDLASLSILTRARSMPFWSCLVTPQLAGVSLLLMHAALPESPALQRIWCRERGNAARNSLCFWQLVYEITFGYFMA